MNNNKIKIGSVLYPIDLEEGNIDPLKPAFVYKKEGVKVKIIFGGEKFLGAIIGTIVASSNGVWFR